MSITWIKAMSSGKPSSHLEEFAHSDGRLFVRFRNGAVHSYPAPDTVFNSMRMAPSAGVFFNNFIKRRPHTRHEDMENPEVKQ